MNTRKLSTAIALCLGATTFAGAVHAAGPLYLWEGGTEPTPYRWNTEAGPIPVYTDGGGAFTYDYDGVTPFITIERANEITQYAFDQWNAVETSTFHAVVAGTIEGQTGIPDVTGANAAEIYEEVNGYGFWVNYDTDGSILKDYFGVSDSVLGIAFPEWANEETGEIIEATAVINGWAVWDTDTEGNQVAAVFTHEFGHAINLSHTQVNGDLFYFSQSYYNRQAGPKGCGPYPPRSSFEQIETMYPFITISQAGVGDAMSTINLTDDKVAISNLYPTPDYFGELGSISGVLTLKDGATPYSGINVIARNVNDWYGDAVSAMTGDQTQGLVGPDGRFTINGLTPGEEYVVYINDIYAGGFPTTPMPIVSQGEYWNAAESNDPVVDDICESTPVTAEAGSVHQADIVFNGYMDGIQYTPIVSAYLTDLAKNGRSSAGLSGSTGFLWDMNHGFKVLPADIPVGNASMTRNAQKMTALYDFNGNGIQSAALVDFQGNSYQIKLVDLGDLNGNTCGGSGVSGTSASYPWDVDADGHTVVGTAYIDTDGDGACQASYKGEIVPFIWTAGEDGGMRALSTEGAPRPTSYLRADVISGDGKVVLGSNGGQAAVAWVDEGELIDLYSMYGAVVATAVNFDGSRVALGTRGETLLWNALTGEVENIGSLEYCTHVPYTSFFGGDYCESYPAEVVWEAFGRYAPVMPTDMNEAGTVIIGRAGNLRSGVTGAIWIEGLGWMAYDDLLYKQGVVEAFEFPMDNPIAIDGKGDDLVGGLAGVSSSWYVDMSEVYVCRKGKDVKTSFPEGMLAQLDRGAEFGRCAFID